jgi:hypothetical protein
MQLVVGKFQFCSGKTVLVVEKKELATCSGKLCLIHAMERRDTQLVVGKFQFCSGKTVLVVGKKRAGNF